VNSKLAHHQYAGVQLINGTSSLLNPASRSSLSYSFAVPADCADQVRVQRLWANGSDAITGITWDGHSYNYELHQGKPVCLTNATKGGIEQDENGLVCVTVPDSSVAVLNFGWDG
jgi:hypothetical protein